MTRLTILMIALLATFAGGCADLLFSDYEEFGDYSEYEDYGRYETELLVHEVDLQGDMGTVAIESGSVSRVSAFTNDGRYAEVDIRAGGRGNAAMALLHFNEGIRADVFFPGAHIVSETDEWGYSYAGVNLTACSGPNDDNWDFDVSGPVDIDVEEGTIPGNVRLIFTAEIPTYGYGASDTDTQTVTGSFEVAPQ